MANVSMYQFLFFPNIVDIAQHIENNIYSNKCYSKKNHGEIISGYYKLNLYRHILE